MTRLKTKGKLAQRCRQAFISSGGRRTEELPELAIRGKQLFKVLNTISIQEENAFLVTYNAHFVKSTASSLFFRMQASASDPCFQWHNGQGQ